MKRKPRRKVAPVEQQIELALHPGEFIRDHKQMAGLTEVETLKTLPPLLAVLGITGFAVSNLLTILLPLR